jgi:hypothetical protein
MSRFFLIVAMSLFSVALFAKSEIFISKDEFGTAKEIMSTDNDKGSIFVTIKSLSIKDLDDGTNEVTIQYEIQNNLKIAIERWELEFDVMIEGQKRKIASLEENGGRLEEKETKSGSVSRRVYRTATESDVTGVKVELEDVLFEKIKRHVQF